MYRIGTDMIYIRTKPPPNTGDNKCIWRGSTSNGSGCVCNLTGKHEK